MKRSHRTRLRPREIGSKPFLRLPHLGRAVPIKRWRGSRSAPDRLSGEGHPSRLELANPINRWSPNDFVASWASARNSPIGSWMLSHFEGGAEPELLADVCIDGMQTRVDGECFDSLIVGQL